MKADLLIIGGGPAGGMTALLAARAGMSVVLCETHATLPPRVCGMYLCPAGVAFVERLGIRERLSSDARRLRGMVMVAPNMGRLETYFPQVDGMPDHGLALPRPSLDETFLDLAHEAGAVIRLGARSVKIAHHDGGWRATLADGEFVDAKLIVGADGRKSFTARVLGLAIAPRRSRTAVHADCAALNAAPPFGQMHVFEDGTYVGLDPITPERVNFSIVCDPAMLRGVAVIDFINQHITRSPHLSILLKPVAAGAKPDVTYPTNARVRRAATRDAALVGDASGYTDPLTGEGIYGALWTAEALVQSIAEGWNDLPAALDRYAELRRRQQWTKTMLCELFQVFIRRPWLANSIHWLLSRRQEVADSFIGIVGNSYSPARGFARIAQQALAF